MEQRKAALVSDRARCAGSALRHAIPEAFVCSKGVKRALRAHTCWATESLAEETPLHRKTAQQLPMTGKRHRRPSARHAAFARHERAVLGVRLHGCLPELHEHLLHL